MSNPTNSTTQPELLRWPVHDITPSPFQERKDFDEQPLKELAESIKANGIIQPLTVRRIGEGALELVCGERRLRAAKLAALGEVPVILRVLTDAQAENIVLMENIQREDLKPSEEARSYERLLKLRDDSGALMHTREGVAKIACKPLNHIDDHLKLLVCPPALQEAVDRDELKLSVAMVVGRIPDPKLRPVAAEKVLHPSYQQVPMNVAQAKELVRKEFMVSLAGVPWRMDDAGLVPVRHEESDGQQVRCFGGDCETCPFRSGNIEEAGVKKTEAAKGKGSGRSGAQREAGGAAGNLCTLPKCHQAKLDVVCKQQRIKALEKGLKALDDTEAKKQFHPSRNETANGAKYVWLDAEPEYHEVGSLCYGVNGRKWRSLLKGSEVPVVMARNPHTGLLVEMSPVKEAKPVGMKALRSKKPSAEEQAEKTPAELKAEEDAKKRRAVELKQEKIDKIALVEVVNDITTQIERKGADGELLSRFFELALQRAGSDGLRFMVKHLEIPTPKKESWWNYDKDVIKLVKERCGERVNAWNGMLALALMSWELAFNGLGADGMKTLARTLGIKLDDVQRRAKALFEAEQNGKAKKPVKPAKDAVGVKEEWSVEKEASKTAAADEIAKGKVKRDAMAKSHPDIWEEWDVGDWLSAAKEVKSGKKKITELIGPTPEKTTAEFITWTAARVKLYKLAKKK